MHAAVYPKSMFRHNGPFEASVSGFPIWAHHHPVTPDMFATDRSPLTGQILLAPGEQSIDVKRRIRNARLPADFGDRHTVLSLPQE